MRRLGSTVTRWRWALLALVVALTVATVAQTQPLSPTQLLPILQRGSTVAVLDLASQTAAITTSNLYVPTAPGLYVVHWYLQVVGTSSATNLVGTIGWHDATTARTLASSTVDCTAQNYTQGTANVWVNSTANAITYSTAFTGGCTYDYGLAVERMY